MTSTTTCILLIVSVLAGAPAADQLNNEAARLHERGNYDAAEKLYRAAIAAWGTEGRASSEKAAITVTNLATLYRQRGRYAEAAPLFERALHILEPNSLTAMTTLNNLAELHRSQRNFPEAEKAATRALDI